MRLDVVDVYSAMDGMDSKIKVHKRMLLRESLDSNKRKLCTNQWMKLDVVDVCGPMD